MEGKKNNKNSGASKNSGAISNDLIDKSGILEGKERGGVEEWAYYRRQCKVCPEGIQPSKMKNRDIY